MLFPLLPQVGGCSLAAPSASLCAVCWMGERCVQACGFWIHAITEMILCALGRGGAAALSALSKRCVWLGSGVPRHLACVASSQLSGVCSLCVCWRAKAAAPLTGDLARRIGGLEPPPVCWAGPMASGSPRKVHDVNDEGGVSYPPHRPGLNRSVTVRPG